MSGDREERDGGRLDEDRLEFSRNDSFQFSAFLPLFGTIFLAFSGV